MDLIYLLLCLAPVIALVSFLLVIRLEMIDARGAAASASSAAKSPARQKRAGTPRMLPMPDVLRVVAPGLLDVMGMN